MVVEAPSAEDTIARRIRQERRLRGLSVRTLAERAGISPRAIAMWESGQRDPGVRYIYALAAALGVNPSDLLPGGGRLP